MPGANLYEIDDQGNNTVDLEGCLECGTCMICCDHEALEWHYPRGEFGIQYRMGLASGRAMLPRPVRLPERARADH